MEYASQQELLDALRSPDPARREMAISEIGNREDPALLPHLFEILDDPSDRIRWRTLQSIGKLGASGVDDRVLGLLNDPSLQVRGEAARVVGLAGRKEHAPALAPLLLDLLNRLTQHERDAVFAHQVTEGVGNLMIKKRQ